jgi:4-amino-4-deoxy-L-arabinose transferase-like glycosyltransferase
MRFFSNQHILKFFLGGLVFVMVGSILVMAWVPPVSRDALTHHLAVPKLYVKQGGMYEIPSIAYSYYPGNLDLLYLVPLLYGNDILPKLIHFAFALLTAWLIFAHLKRRADPLFALAGVVFFLSLPVIVRLSTTVYVDLGLIFFSTLALIYFLKWIEYEFDIKYLIISAVGCGFALGTKYNALIVLFLFAAFVPFVYSRKKQAPEISKNAGHPFFNPRLSLKAIGCSIVYVLVALVVFSPWAIRNYAWTKNPVYPLFDHHFKKPDLERQSEAGPDASDIVGEAARGPSVLFKPFVTRKVIYGEAWWQTLLIPLRIFFQGHDDRPEQFDGRLNPYLLLLPILAYFLNRKTKTADRTETNILMAFAVLFITISFFQADMRIRYITPAIPPLVILAIFGLRGLLTAIDGRLKGGLNTFGKSVVVLTVLFLVSLNAAYIWNLYHRIDPLSYIGGRLSRDQYIERYRPEYAALRFANKNLPPDARILGLFLGNRSYYSDRELIFGESFFKNTVLRENSARQIARALKEKKITHILVYYRVFKQWSGHNFDHRQRVILVDFFSHQANLVFAKGEYGLYQL